MKKTYKVSAIIADVTEWNSDSQNWSGEHFSEEFYGDVTITTEKLTRLQLQDAITELIDSVGDYLSEGSLVITDDSVILRVTENDDSLPDSEGKYLVDYTCRVTEIVEVNLIDNMQ